MCGVEAPPFMLIARPLSVVTGWFGKPAAPFTMSDSFPVTGWLGV